MPKHVASKQVSTAEFLGASIDSANDGFENIGPVMDVPDHHAGHIHLGCKYDFFKFFAAKSMAI